MKNTALKAIARAAYDAAGFAGCVIDIFYDRADDELQLRLHVPGDRFVWWSEDRQIVLRDPAAWFANEAKKAREVVDSGRLASPEEVEAMVAGH